MKNIIVCCGYVDTWDKSFLWDGDKGSPGSD